MFCRFSSCCYCYLLCVCFTSYSASSVHILNVLLSALSLSLVSVCCLHTACSDQCSCSSSVCLYLRFTEDLTHRVFMRCISSSTHVSLFNVVVALILSRVLLLLRLVLFLVQCLLFVKCTEI